MYSSGEQGQDPKVAQINWDLLPSAEPEEPAFDGGHADVWAHKRGEVKGGGERMSSVMFRTRESAVAAHGVGFIDDPVLPKATGLPEIVERRVRILSREIRDRKKCSRKEALQANK